MGVFDYISFEAGIPGCPISRFQTKDLDAQWLDEYFVTAGGLLEHQVYDLEEVPASDRPFPGAEPGSFEAWVGSKRRVKARRVGCPEFSGLVNFYSDGFEGLLSIGLQGQGNQEFDPHSGEFVPEADREWFEYEVEFVQGVMQGSPRRMANAS